MFWKISRWFGLVLMSLALLPGIYLFASVILSLIPTRQEGVNMAEVSVYIVTSGIHTDLVLPFKTDPKGGLGKVLPDWIKADSSITHYVAFGWGNREFYLETPTWADLKFSTAMKAVFGIGPSAMHITFTPDITAGPGCKQILLSREQHSRLIRYIERSFVRNPQGDLLRINTGNLYGPNEFFYEANGRFSMFYTCNTWVNDALKACGQKACLWTPFDKGIFFHYHPDRVAPCQGGQ